MVMMFNTEMIVKVLKGSGEYMTEKRFTVAVYDENAINGFTVLDLEKPNSSKRLKYENVYIGSKVGCEIVCNFGNSLAEENKQLKQQLKLKEAEERINCRKCIYFISGQSSDSCLKREDIGYKGTCIDGMDYHYLAKNCPYY